MAGTKKLVGENTRRRICGPVTGRSKYAEDFRAQGMVHAAAPEPLCARARQEHRRQRRTRDAWREGHPDG